MWHQAADKHSTTFNKLTALGFIGSDSLPREPQLSTQLIWRLARDKHTYARGTHSRSSTE